MDFAADLNLFYADFGQSVTWTPQIGSPVTALALRPLALTVGGAAKPVALPCFPIAMTRIWCPA